MGTNSLWQRFQKYFLRYDDLGFSIDISRMRFPDDFFERMQPRVEQAFAAMRELEAGGDRQPRRETHGRPLLAARSRARAQRRASRRYRRDQYARSTGSPPTSTLGRITGARRKPFEHVLLIGIGGSALGPQFVADALGTSRDRMDLHFFDNTDPGRHSTASSRRSATGSRDTLVVVISKSGGTKETRNGMLEAERVYEKPA